MYLRQSTASQEILLGPFLDSVDGSTAETGLTIANTDIKIWKHGGTTEANKNSGGATHIAGGRYYAVLDATDTDTIGMIEINVHVAGALPVRRLYTVLDEAVYDVMFGTTALSTYAGADTSGTTTLLSRIGGSLTITSGRVNADVTHIATAAVSTTTAQLGVNVVQAGGTAWGSGAITAASIAADAITDAKVASDVNIASVTGSVGSVTGAVGSVTGNVGGNVVGSVGSVTAAVTLPTIPTDWITAAGIAADAIGASELAASAVSEIQSGLSTLDAAGVRSAVGLASANLDTQISTLATAANLATVAGYLDTEIAAILADTNELQTDWANGGRLDLLIDAIKAKTDLIVLNDIADALLKRDMSAVTGEAARSLLNALRFLRNKWSISAGTLTVTKEDDATSAWTATLTTNASAEPITASDPA